MAEEQQLEAQRVQALCALAILDSAPEERFDRYTRIAAAAFSVPLVLVSLVDEQRQWFKARYGLDATETPREFAFCSHAIDLGDTLVVPNALEDPRFAANPLVTGAPHIRFYAGHPVRTLDGFAVGTLCIIDREPRQLDAAGRRMLADLAAMVSDELNKSSVNAARERAEQALQALNASLEASVLERTEALAQKQELLDAVLETVDVGVIACDADGTLTLFNRAARAFHGQSNDAIQSEEWAQRYDLFRADGVTPLPLAEIPLLRALRGEAVKDAKMVIAPRGMLNRSLLASGRRLLSPSGARLGAVVAMHDITASRAAAQRQAESEERLLTITNNLPVLISYLDRDFRFHFANDMHKDWTGVHGADMLGKTVLDVYGEVHYAERAACLRSCLAGNMSHIELGMTYKGHTRMLSSSYIPHLRDGQVLGMYVLSSDCTAAHEHGRQLLELANTDSLTGLPNRRKYEETLEQALARARRQCSGMALMFLDIDHFKQVNDTLGHGAGDEVLQEFGRRLKAVVRSTDTVARLAGDEFTVILEFVENSQQCALIAEKIVSAMAAPFAVGGRYQKVAASIGVAYCEDGRSAAALGRQADTALYEAKQGGRNSYRVHAGDPRELRHSA